MSFYSGVESQRVKNLNSSQIRVDKYDDMGLKDNSCESQSCRVEVIFRNHKERLLRMLAGYDTVLGCIAWLTDFDILHRLRGKRVSIVIQKEDFLKPDYQQKPRWKDKLRDAYGRLDCGEHQFDLPWPLCHMVTFGAPKFWGVRCVGNHNRDKLPSFPRMHNKFLVLTNWIDTEGGQDEEDFPLAGDACVWTGSCNLSRASSASLENVVILHDAAIVRAYLNEYAQIMALSEPLDWESDWCAPEYLIGT